MAKRSATKQREGLLFFLPKRTLPLETILEDLEWPSAGALAKALGVLPETAHRWITAGKAPRAALLALFYATRWGRADVHYQAEKDARTQAALAFYLQCELDKANALLTRLGQIGDFGSANDPARHVASRAPASEACLADGDTSPAPATGAKPKKSQTTSEKRAGLAAKRLSKRASGPPKPFDFLRFG